jgi:hypothetical protein
LTNSRARRRFSRAVAVTALVLVSLLTGAQAATALGWSPVVPCGNGGILSGRSYQITFSNAGGNSYADSGCGPNAAIILRYQAYPGGPWYNTSQSIAYGTVSKAQSGSWNGYHKAFTTSGVQVGLTNS